MASPEIDLEDRGSDRDAIGDLSAALLVVADPRDRLEAAAEAIHHHLGCPTAAAFHEDLSTGVAIEFAVPVHRRAHVAQALATFPPQACERGVAAGTRLRLSTGRAWIDTVLAGRATIAVVGAPEGAVPYLETAGRVVAAALTSIEATPAEGPQMTLAWTAHELRGPLAAIRAAVDQALTAEDPTDRRPLLEAARDELEGLSEVADAMLRWGRPERPLDRRRVDLRELVRGVLASETSRAAHADMRLQGDAPVAADVDPIQLGIAVSNLVRNAIAHAPSEIAVEVDADQEYATIAVIDAGPGLPSEVRDRIFDPFVRGRGSSPDSGTGLGLFIARRIVEEHGGTLCADTGSRGTVFRIVIPRTTSGGDLRSAS